MRAQSGVPSGPIDAADLNKEACKFSAWYLANALPHLHGIEQQNAANYLGAAFINGYKACEEKMGIRK